MDVVKYGVEEWGQGGPSRVKIGMESEAGRSAPIVIMTDKNKSWRSQVRATGHCGKSARAILPHGT